MTARFLQFVALAGSFLLVLPPGWCGAFVGGDRADSAAITCCRTGPVSTPDEAPAAPESDCCCDRAATPASRVTSPSDLLAAALPLVSVVDLMPKPGPQCLRLSTEGVLRSGPRRHVLQCVWLC
ncbi:MAG: hypothetical protein ACF8TS_18185 [Maioricimonas sp. JB049]